MLRPHGIFAPITTPFRHDGTVDLDALGANLSRYARSRLAGIVVLGSTGEAPLLSEHEADAVVEAARAGIPRSQLMIVGTGREATAATIAATRRAAAAGADAVLVRAPSYFRSHYDTESFVAFFEAVADASAVPVLLYNALVFTAVTLPVEAVERLARHPNVAGLKDSGSPLERLIEFVRVTPPDFAVLTGSATALEAALGMGAAGGVVGPACVAPDLYANLYELAVAGRHAEARGLQQRLWRLSDLLDGVPATKAALDAAGYAGGPPRPPLRPVAADVGAAIHTELTALTSPAP